MYQIVPDYRAHSQAIFRYHELKWEAEERGEAFTQTLEEFLDQLRREDEKIRLENEKKQGTKGRLGYRFNYIED